MKALFTAVLPVCCLWLLSGCDLQQTKEDQANQKEATVAAIKALGRVEAATQVGVNFQRYGEVVIDAKSAVNEAERVLPEGDLRFCLSRAMRAYQDANTAWSWKIQARAGLTDELHKEIIDRYQLRSGMKKAGLSCDVAMQVMWVRASETLAAAREVEQKPSQDSQLSRQEAERERDYKAAEAKREREKAEAERRDREAREKAAREEAEAKAKREREEAEAKAKREREEAEAEARRKQEEAEAAAQEEAAVQERAAKAKKEEAAARERREQEEAAARERGEREEAARRLKEQQEKEARVRVAHLSYAKELLGNYGEGGPEKRAKGAERLAWIVKEYPGSDEANEAAKLLEQIKKDGGP